MNKHILVPHCRPNGGVTCSQDYFAELSSVIARMPHDDIESICDVLSRAYERSSKILLFGNGGSASLASHFACDLSKGTSSSDKSRKRMRSEEHTSELQSPY